MAPGTSPLPPSSSLFPFLSSLLFSLISPFFSHFSSFLLFSPLLFSPLLSFPLFSSLLSCSPLPSSLLLHHFPHISEVSLHLWLCDGCGAVTSTTQNVWQDMLIKFSPNLVMNPVTVMEVKKGLEFGLRVGLPKDLSFSHLLLAQLFASEGHVRPFQHLRWGTWCLGAFGVETPVLQFQESVIPLCSPTFHYTCTYIPQALC